jgi:small subunit ribosomal protein S20
LPTTRTAEKEMRVAERRKARNKSVRSETKTEVTLAENAISAGDLDAAKAAVKTAVSSLDKESERGKVHPNNAARRKSRLIKKLNKAAIPAKAETKTAKKTVKKAEKKK